MSEEKRIFCDYTVEQSIFVGNKEVILGVDGQHTQKYRFLVCYCSYDNPLGVPWPTEAVGTDDYLEAMQVFLDRVQAQVGIVRNEQEQYRFDKTPFTAEDCIPDDKGKSIVGKVVVINAEPKRYEYQHAAYQLVLADGGNGATGGRGQAVFGTCLATGERGRWERYDVLGEIKPERTPDWAKEALAKIKAQEKRKTEKSGGTLIWRYDLYCPKNRNTPIPRVCSLRGRRATLGICVAILPTLDMAFIPLGLIPESNGKRMNLRQDLTRLSMNCGRTKGFYTTAMICGRLQGVIP